MSQSCIFHGSVAACIHVSGDDALAFLKSQMTVSIPESQEMQWTYGLWLNESGRILADSYVYAQAADSCLLWSFFCPAELLTNTISRNIVADQVELTDVTADFAFSILTSRALASGTRAKLEAFTGLTLPDPRQVYSDDEYFLMGGSPLDNSDLLWIAPPDFHVKLQEELTGIKIHPMVSEAFEIARITAGVPAIPRDLNHRNLPQEGSFREPVIDYQKGCFPGQEIMAKFRKGGKLNKHIQVVEFSTDSNAQTTDWSTPLEIRSGKSVVGTITSLAQDGTTLTGLGLIRERAIGKPLHVHAVDGKDCALRINS